MMTPRPSGSLPPTLFGDPGTNKPAGPWNAVPLRVSPWYAGYRLPDGSSTYVVRCLVTDRVKIGTTKKDPIDRLETFQPGSPTEIELFASLRVYEGQAHLDLANARLHGEWFEAHDYVYQYIARWRVFPIEAVKEGMVSLAEARASRLASANRMLVSQSKSPIRTLAEHSGCTDLQVWTLDQLANGRKVVDLAVERGVSRVAVIKNRDSGIAKIKAGPKMLSGRQRQVIDLRDAGHSWDYIAREMQVSSGTCRKTHQRAVKAQEVIDKIAGLSTVTLPVSGE